ncbi:MAG: molybdate ABC transporter substrate-binding protein [Desulfomicrobium sp.]
MKKILLTLLPLLMSMPALAGETLLIASGAGYKTVIEALAKSYSQQAGTTVERIYGNMGQIAGQAQSSGKVDLVVGEDSLLRASTLPLGDATPLGAGRLVMAWPKGKSQPADLNSTEIGRIAIPDVTLAIYGKAAMEYLNNSGQYAALKGKLVVVGTVPQVFTYLSTGEVDAGFLNLTQAMAVTKQLGGYIEVDQKFYKPIAIACIRLQTSPNTAAATDFTRFLRTEEARAILAAHGL